MSEILWCETVETQAEVFNRGIPTVASQDGGAVVAMSVVRYTGIYIYTSLSLPGQNMRPGVRLSYCCCEVTEFTKLNKSYISANIRNCWIQREYSGMVLKITEHFHQYWKQFVLKSRLLRRDLVYIWYFVYRSLENSHSYCTAKQFYSLWLFLKLILKFQNPQCNHRFGPTLARAGTDSDLQLYPDTSLRRVLSCYASLRHLSNVVLCGKWVNSCFSGWGWVKLYGWQDRDREITMLY